MVDKVYAAVAERELERYGDAVHLRWESGGKHPRAILQVGQLTRFLTVPASGSDHRGPLNFRSQLRRTLGEMGATPEMGVVGKIAVYHGSVMITIPPESPLYQRFVSGDGKPKAWWSMKAIANPEPKGDPILGLSFQGDVKPDDPERRPGLMRGSLNQVKHVQLTVMPSRLPAIAKLGPFAAGPLSFAGEENETILLKLPKDRALPVGYEKEKPPQFELPKPATAKLGDIAHIKPNPPLERLKHHVTGAIERGEKQSIVEQKPVPPAPAPLATRPPAREAVTPLAFPDKVQLVMPREPVSLKRAVDIINHNKEKMGESLNLSITPDGFLEVIAAYGRKTR
jgi:hypothetical protein